MVECLTRLGFVNDSRRVVKTSMEVVGNDEVEVEARGTVGVGVEVEMSDGE